MLLVLFLFTLPVRVATRCASRIAGSPRYFYSRHPCGQRPGVWLVLQTAGYFYSRHPCGQRPLGYRTGRTASDFYSRHPCGQRPAHTGSDSVFSRFLFTPPVWAATYYAMAEAIVYCRFLFTPPVWAATQHQSTAQIPCC